MDLRHVVTSGNTNDRTQPYCLQYWVVRKLDLLLELLHAIANVINTCVERLAKSIVED